MNCFRLGVNLRERVSIGNYLRVCVGRQTNAGTFGTYSSQIQYPNEKLWFTPDELEHMSRRVLQKWCKKLGIRANSKTIQLRKDLEDFHRDVLSNSSILKQAFLPVTTATKFVTGSRSSLQRAENGLFVWRNSDGIKTNLSDTTVALPHGIRHYNKTACEVTEICDDDLVFVDCINLTESKPRFPSVNAILRATIPKNRLFAISHWTKKQKELLGEEGFCQQMNEVKRSGSEFHKFVHQCLAGQSLDNRGPTRLQGFMESTKRVFDRLGDAVTCERNISHNFLGYKGRLDTLACYDGEPSIIEWKTSRKKKHHLEDCGDYPLQVVAYAGAVNSDASFGFQVKQGVIVIAYEDGSPANVHCMDMQLCRSIWQDWLVRVHRFYSQQLTMK